MQGKAGRRRAEHEQGNQTATCSPALPKEPSRGSGGHRARHGQPPIAAREQPQVGKQILRREGRVAQIQLKAHVLVKTAGLRPEETRAAHFTPIDDVSAAVRTALDEAGAAATLCVLPQGPQTIPYLAGEA